jgi:hypothetical protein
MIDLQKISAHKFRSYILGETILKGKEEAFFAHF